MHASLPISYQYWYVSDIPGYAAAAGSGPAGSGSRAWGSAPRLRVHHRDEPGDVVAEVLHGGLAHDGVPAGKELGSGRKEHLRLPDRGQVEVGESEAKVLLRRVAAHAARREADDPDCRPHHFALRAFRSAVFSERSFLIVAFFFESES